MIKNYIKCKKCLYTFSLTYIATMVIFQISLFLSLLDLFKLFVRVIFTLKKKILPHYLYLCVIQSHPYATKTYCIKEKQYTGVYK